MRLVILIAAFLLTGTCTAPAMASLPQGLEQQLRADIDYAMKWCGDITTLAGEGLTFDKNYDVIPHDSHFEVRLKKMGVLLRSGYSASVGDVVLNIKPSQQEEGGWVLSAAIPPKVDIFDPAKKIIGTATFEKQSLTASWLPLYDLFPRVDMGLENLKISMHEQTIDIGIDKISVARNLVRDAEKRWSGQKRYALLGLRVNTDNEISMTEARVKSMTGFEDIQNASYETIARVKEKYEAAVQKSQATADPAKVVPLEEAQELASEILETFSYLPDAYEGGFEIAEATLTVGPKQKKYRKYYDQEPPEPFTITLPKVTGQAFMSDLKAELAAGFIKAFVENISFSGAPEDTSEFMPRNISIGVNLKDLPVRQFSKIVPALLVHAFEGKKDETEEERAERLARAREIAAPLPDAMEKSGTQLVLNDTYYTSDTLVVRMEGTLDASATSPLLGVGTVTLKLVGLDETISRYLSMKNNPHVVNHARAMIPFQLMGQMGKDENGTSMRSYALELTPQGNFKMNGVDLLLARQLMHKYIIDNRKRDVSYPGRGVGADVPVPPRGKPQ